MPDLLSIKEAAETLGLTTAAIRQAIKRRTLHGTAKVNQVTWLIDRAEVERYGREVARKERAK